LTFEFEINQPGSTAKEFVQRYDKF